MRMSHQRKENHKFICAIAILGMFLTMMSCGSKKIVLPIDSIPKENLIPLSKQKDQSVEMPLYEIVDSAFCQYLKDFINSTKWLNNDPGFFIMIYSRDSTNVFIEPFKYPYVGYYEDCDGVAFLDGYPTRIIFNVKGDYSFHLSEYAVDRLLRRTAKMVTLDKIYTTEQLWTAGILLAQGVAGDVWKLDISGDEIKLVWIGGE